MKPICKHRLRLSIGKGADGIYHYKSFTGYGDTPAQARREAERLSREWQVLHKSEPHGSGMKLSEAFQRYIDSRTNVCSPSTIRKYVSISKNNLQSIMNCYVDELTQEMIQQAINTESGTRKPKTVRNIHGLLSAVLKQSGANLSLNTKLPQKIRYVPYVPSNDDINRLIQVAKPDELKIILLAAIGSFRRSEICGFMPCDISGNTITVNRVIVKDTAGKYVVKLQGKSEDSLRTVTLPPHVIEKLVPPDGSEYIVGMNPDNAYKAFKRALKRAGLHDFRLHDLRHYQASILHAMGVPDKYIMARGGWKTDATLKNIYQHAMSEKQKEVDATICDYFTDKFKL